MPRGKALGYTLNLPQEDRYLKSREELIDYMKVLLAGRVSEQITFGKVTTGASDDLKRVSAIARSMVYEYAMGTTIRSHHLPADDFTLSEALRRTRDEEVGAIAEEAYRGAHQLLVDHRDLLDQIAERLLTNEVIEHEEIQRDHGLEPQPRRAAATSASTSRARARRPRRWRASRPSRRSEPAAPRLARELQAARIWRFDSPPRARPRRRRPCRRGPVDEPPAAGAALCTPFAIRSRRGARAAGSPTATPPASCPRASEYDEADLAAAGEHRHHLGSPLPLPATQ